MASFASAASRSSRAGCFSGLRNDPRVLCTEAAVAAFNFLMPIPPIESVGRNRVHELHREIRLRQRIRHERHARRAIKAGQPQLLDDGDVGLQQMIEPTGAALDAALAAVAWATEDEG